MSAYRLIILSRHRAFMSSASCLTNSRFGDSRSDSNCESLPSLPPRRKKHNVVASTRGPRPLPTKAIRAAPHTNRNDYCLLPTAPARVPRSTGSTTPSCLSLFHSHAASLSGSRLVGHLGFAGRQSSCGEKTVSSWMGEIGMNTVIQSDTYVCSLTL